MAKRKVGSQRRTSQRIAEQQQQVEAISEESEESAAATENLQIEENLALESQSNLEPNENDEPHQDEEEFEDSEDQNRSEDTIYLGLLKDWEGLGLENEEARKFILKGILPDMIAGIDDQILWDLNSSIKTRVIINLEKENIKQRGIGRMKEIEEEEFYE